ncbi:MAG: diguanylate cyclase [Gemmatimonadota bacterium]|nr:diguanylate cyclase [Gemmatimonadota bacterium]
MRGRSIKLALIVGGSLTASSVTLAQSATRGLGQPTSIAAALAARRDSPVAFVAGRAVVATGKLQSSAFDIAIDDGTSGMRLFSRSPQIEVKEGDSVNASGVIKTYRGNVELVVDKMSIVPGARRAVAIRDVAIDPELIAQHPGQLIRVRGRVAGFGHSEGGQWLRLTNETSTRRGALTVWVPANHGAPIDLGAMQMTDSVVVTGIVTSYQDNADDPVVWQLVPRDAADVQVTASAKALPAWLLWAALAGALLLGAILTVSRVTARRQLHALRETEARYRQLLALLPDVVLVHSHGTIVFANPAAAELLGLPSEQSLVGRPLLDFVRIGSVDSFAAQDGDASGAAPAREPRIRAQMLGADGNIVEVEVTSSPCVYHTMPATVVLARDITAQLRYERDLHALALIDELTGLQNRRAFTLLAEQELARARRYGRTPVVVFADLDGLKQINDQYGHAAGDTAIRLVANALRSIFRETDIVARWSGDEFVALMIEGSDEASQMIASRLDAAIAVQSPLGLPYLVTASVGATALDPALPLRDAMERADVELYTQKKRGRRSKVRATPIGVDLVRQQD